MSAASVINALAEILSSDAALAAFCTARWGKPLAVRISWRNRAEIAADELPLILLTSPKTERARDYGSIDQKRKVRLYAGFYNPDREQAPIDLVDFEEEVCAALERNTKISGTGTITSPLESVNDEGSYAPTYFFAGEISVTVNP